MSIYTFFVLQPYAFLAHNSEYNTGVKRAAKTSMEYSGLSRSEILELIKQQKAAILQTKIDMEPADNPQAQLIISELKTDLHKLLTALQNYRTRSIAHIATTHHKL